MALILKNAKTNNEEVVLHEGKVVGIEYRPGGYCYNYYAIVYHKEEDRIEEIHYERDDYESYNMSWCDGTCKVDATEDVMSAYKARLLRDERHNMAEKLYKEYLDRHDAIKMTRLSFGEYMKLANAYNGDAKFEWIVALLCVKNFRSEFRKKLSEQVRSWLKELTPKFNRPLSPKQLECLRPYTPYRRF
ncbi:MAG: hypothetical protein MJZ34_08295 [Paludibacteraceae bacterium]|nr:hypothetical protein [Paludibacteraceae bacterium]